MNSVARAMMRTTRSLAGSGAAALLSSIVLATACGSTPGPVASRQDAGHDAGLAQSVDAGEVPDASERDGSESETCIAACGTGDVVGEWGYHRVCGDGVLATTARSCGPDSVYTIRTNTVRGRLAVAGATYVHEQTRVLAGTLDVLSDCFAPFGGCAAYGASLAPSGGCVETSARCLCTLSSTATRTSSGAFAQDGNEIVLSTPVGDERYEFCSTGTELTIQLSGGGAVEAYALRPE